MTQTTFPFKSPLIAIFFSVIMAGCMAPVDPGYERRMDAFHAELNVRRAERSIVRARLDSNPESADAATHVAEISRLNSEVARLEVMLDFPRSKPMSTSPISNPQLLPGGLTALDRAEFAQTDFSTFVVQAKAGLTANFKDPFTVQYRKLFIGHSGRVPALCGELNGKNSYGGYIGFRRFVATETGEYTIASDADSIVRNAQLEYDWCRDLVREIQ